LVLAEGAVTLDAVPLAALVTGGHVETGEPHQAAPLLAAAGALSHQSAALAMQAFAATPTAG
jgi:hypothetical protein